MRTVKGALLVFALVSAAGAQSPEPPLSDTRLTVHTLVREDIFAGFMTNDMNRFARAERNIEVLLAERPAERAALLAWKGSTALYRAVLAHESGRTEEFERLFQAARDAFAEATRLESDKDGVAAVVGGSFSVFSDRLPAEHRAAAWSQAYDAYALLWKEQEAILDKLPVHHRGELLGGLAQSAQRTGRVEEAAEHVDRMLTALQDTPYEATARQWKADPASAAGTTLTCKYCHNPGRLSARLAALKQ
jgi:tetratricopeptide (TPR) repeat protein